MKNKFPIYLLILIGFLFMLTNSCKKSKVPVITWANPVDITYGTLLSAIQLNATANVPGTFVYTPTTGTKLDVGSNQILSVLFTPTDAESNKSISKTVMINVNAKKVPIITWPNPANIGYGNTLSSTQLNATADVPGTFFYTPSIGTRLSIGLNQVLKVFFTPIDIISNDTVSKTVSINVNDIVTDIDGNVYNTVTIGTQVWMVENLKTKHYRNGDPIPNVINGNQWCSLSTGAYCSYNNDDSLATIYGQLYNWYALNNSSSLCPDGWHIPTYAEWTTLVNYLGGDMIAGGKLKETGTTHWQSPNGGASNESSFFAIPGGYRDDIFNAIGLWALFWTNTPTSPETAYCRSMDYIHSYITTTQESHYKYYGVSVRCVKD